ncbi:hypothetical protein ACROYT_G036706 [Oculina patagonica]
MLLFVIGRLRLNGKLIQRVEEQEKLAVAMERCRSNAIEDSSDSDVDTSLVEEKQQIKEKETGKKVKSNKKEKDRKKRKRKHKDMQKNNEPKLQDEHVSYESEVKRKASEKEKGKKQESEDLTQLWWCRNEIVVKRNKAVTNRQTRSPRGTRL